MMHPETRLRLRVGFLLFLFLAGLLAVAGRAAQLQIGQHTFFAKLAANEYLSKVRIPARRGHVYDRSGKPLAISVDVPSVYANPMTIEDPRIAARTLSSMLNLDLDTVYRRLSSERLFVWIKRQVTPEVEQKVRAAKIPGVAITSESRRFYPHRETGAQLVGFTGLDARGLEGIEKAFDKELAGEPQVVPTLRDARGNPVLSESLDPEHRASGSDVHLTIDLQIQHAADLAVKRVAETSHAKSAMAVVLDVASADILALANYPQFNPNKASTAPAAHRRNRVISDMFEPGSTLKPLAMAAALDAGLLESDGTIFAENGSLTIGTHTIKDSHPLGRIDLTTVLKRSSNIAAAKIGLKLGRERFGLYLSSMGFGSRSLGLLGESAGRLRPSRTWSEVGLATIAFGYGIAVSPLQLASAYRILAARGAYRPARVVARIDHPERGTTLVKSKPERRVLSGRVAQEVAEMMEAVVSAEGTGWRAAIPGYRVAGKTGTSHKIDPVFGGYSDEKYVAVFAGFLPVHNPRVVITVFVDEPQGVHSGGAVAAPVFAEIGAACMRHLGVIPSGAVVNAALLRARGLGQDDEAQVDAPVASRLADIDDTDAVPSFLGLTARQAVQRFSKLEQPIKLELQGQGRVVNQDPSPGTKSSKVRRVRLSLAL